MSSAYWAALIVALEVVITLYPLYQLKAKNFDTEYVVVSFMFAIFFLVVDCMIAAVYIYLSL